MIGMKDLPSIIQQPIYAKGGVCITMTVDTESGETKFEAFIDGKRVPLSSDNHLYSAVRVLNNELFYRGRYSTK